MNGATGSIYSGGSGADRSYHVLCSESSHNITSHCTTNHRLYVAYLLISVALAETPCGSMELRGSPKPGGIISLLPLPTLLKPERLFSMKSFWNAMRGAAEC